MFFSQNRKFSRFFLNREVPFFSTDNVFKNSCKAILIFFYFGDLRREGLGEGVGGRGWGRAGVLALWGRANR